MYSNYVQSKFRTEWDRPIDVYPKLRVVSFLTSHISILTLQLSGGPPQLTEGKTAQEVQWEQEQEAVVAMSQYRRRQSEQKSTNSQTKSPQYPDAEQAGHAGGGHEQRHTERRGGRDASLAMGDKYENNVSSGPSSKAITAVQGQDGVYTLGGPAAVASSQRLLRMLHAYCCYTLMPPCAVSCSRGSSVLP